jgi:hypothetical protein
MDSKENICPSCGIVLHNSQIAIIRNQNRASGYSKWFLDGFCSYACFSAARVKTEPSASPSPYKSLETPRQSSQQSLLSLGSSLPAKLISYQTDFLQATIEIEEQIFHVIDDFNGTSLSVGSVVSVDIVPSFQGELSCADVFDINGNKGISHIEGLKYAARGLVKQVNPVLCDCGLCTFQVPIIDADDTLIGEYICFEISHFTACGPQSQYRSNGASLGEWLL